MQQPQPLRIPDSAFAFDQAYKSGPYPQLITSGWNDRTAHIYPLLMLMTEKVTEERQKLYNGVKWQQVIVGISKACQMEKEDVQVLVFEQEAILLFRLQTQAFRANAFFFTLAQRAYIRPYTTAVQAPETPMQVAFVVDLKGQFGNDLNRLYRLLSRAGEIHRLQIYRSMKGQNLARCRWWTEIGHAHGVAIIAALYAKEKTALEQTLSPDQIKARIERGDINWTSHLQFSKAADKEERQVDALGGAIDSIGASTAGQVGSKYAYTAKKIVRVTAGVEKLNRRDAAVTGDRTELHGVLDTTAAAKHRGEDTPEEKASSVSSAVNLNSAKGEQLPKGNKANVDPVKPGKAEIGSPITATKVKRNRHLERPGKTNYRPTPPHVLIARQRHLPRYLVGPSIDLPVVQHHSLPGFDNLEGPSSMSHALTSEIISASTSTGDGKAVGNAGEVAGSDDRWTRSVDREDLVGGGWIRKRKERDTDEAFPGLGAVDAVGMIKDYTKRARKFAEKGEYIDPNKPKRDSKEDVEMTKQDEEAVAEEKHSSNLAEVSGRIRKTLGKRRMIRGLDVSGLAQVYKTEDEWNTLAPLDQKSYWTDFEPIPAQFWHPYSPPTKDPAYVDLPSEAELLVAVTECLNKISMDSGNNGGEDVDVVMETGVGE